MPGAPATSPRRIRSSSIKDHVLLAAAAVLPEIDAEMKALLTEEKFADIVDTIPDAWLPEDPGFGGKTGQREAYLRFFTARLRSSAVFVEEALRARAAYL